MKRYFLITYAADTVDKDRFLGMHIYISDGKFVNKRLLISEIKKEGAANNVEVAGVLITNIIELNESDYLDWYE